MNNPSQPDITIINDFPFPERPPVRYKRFPPDLWGLSKRYILVILIHMGFTISFAIRNNKCFPAEGTDESSKIHEWFLVAYFLVQLPAGIFSYKQSATDLFGYCILGSTIVSFLTPLMKPWNASTTEMTSVLQGIFQGAAQPAFYTIWRYWAPPLERSTLVTLGYAGTFTGVVVGYQLSATFCNAFSWEQILFVYGILGLVWYLLWSWLIFERPIQHPTISDKEYVYLKETIDFTKEKPPIPWKQMLTSMPVWALLIATSSRFWNLVYFQHGKYSQALYVKELKWGLHIEMNHLLMLIAVPLFGFLADYILKSTSVSATKLRKIYISGGLMITFLMFFSFLFDLNHNESLIELEVDFIVVIFSIILAGFYANHLDIAAQYAGITISLANVLSTIAALIPTALNVDFFSSFMENPTESFTLTVMLVNLVGAITYLFFGTAQQQSWTKLKQSEPEEQRGFENQVAAANSNNIEEVRGIHWQYLK